MSEDIISDRFTEWTNGLNPTEARISIYEHIRDIPYAIIPELRDPDTGPAGLIKLNKGSCVPKHFLLVLMLGKIGLSVKYVTYLFNWNDPAIKFPEAIKKVAQNMPITAHLACKAYIDNKWVLVDATYDPPLKDVGFTVNEKWDGTSDTKNAVTPVKEVVHESLQERLDFADKRASAHTEKEKAAYAEFTKKLNLWLEEVRGKEC